MHHFRRLSVFPVLLALVLGFVALQPSTQSASAQSPTALVTPTCSTPVPSAPVQVCTNTFSAPVNAGTTVAISVQGGGSGMTISCNVPSGMQCNVSSDNSGATLVCQSVCQPGQSFVMVIPSGASLYFSAGGTAQTYTGPNGTIATYTGPNGGTATAYTTGAPGYTPPLGQITVGNPNPSFQISVTTTQPQSAYPTGGQCVNGSYPTVYGCTGSYVPYFVPITNSCSWWCSNGGCFGIWWGCSSMSVGCGTWWWSCGGNNCFNSCFFGRRFGSGFGFGGNGGNGGNGTVTINCGNMNTGVITGPINCAGIGTGGAGGAGGNRRFR